MDEFSFFRSHFLEKINVLDRIKETMDICNINSMNKYYHKKC